MIASNGPYHQVNSAEKASADAVRTHREEGEFGDHPLDPAAGQGPREPEGAGLQLPCHQRRSDEHADQSWQQHQEVRQVVGPAVVALLEGDELARAGAGR